MSTDRHCGRAAASVWAIGLLCAATLAWSSAHAEGKRFALDNATYRSECGSCHIPYPPALLPAGSWQAVLNGLDKHFGTDASVDAKTLAALRAYLDQNAARGRRATADPAVPRISETGWFRHEHDDVPAATWKNALVKSPANCPACHTGAADGNYSERGIRLPR